MEEGMPRPAALAAIALTAASDGVFFVGTRPFSEMVFAALLISALLMLRRIERRPVPAAYVCVTGFVIGLALLTRASGLALLAAAAAVLLYRRSFRNASLLVLTAGILYAPWMLWVRAHPYAGRTEAYYTAANYHAWNIVFGFAPAEKLAILQGNLVRLAAVPLMLLNIPDRFWPFLIVAAGVMMAVGLYRIISTRRSFIIPVFLIFHFGVLMLWAWPMERFAAPVFPLILYLLWTALEKLRGQRWFRWPMTAAALAAIAYSGLIHYENIRSTLANGAGKDWAALSSMTAWIQRSTPEDAIVLSTVDPTIYLSTGRKGLRVFDMDPAVLFYQAATETRPAINPADIADKMIESRATYLVTSRVHGGAPEVPATNNAIAKVLRGWPDAFRLVYQGPPGYAVYQIDRNALRPTTM
jgi:hypothetical protein